MRVVRPLLCALLPVLVACGEAASPGVTSVAPGGFVPLEGTGGIDAAAGEPGGGPALADAGPRGGGDGGGTGGGTGGGADTDAGGGTVSDAGGGGGPDGGAGPDAGGADAGGTDTGGAGPDVATPDGGAPDACVPVTCDGVGAECGSVDDGCGGVLACGDCPAGEGCGLKEPNRCSCAPKTCAETGVQCGAASDGCGGLLACGGCPAGSTCAGGSCCTPSCGGKQCGDDGCGGSCGSCPGGTCVAGQCASPGYCTGKCGSNNPSDCGNNCDCYCDAVCFQYGDCCDDVCTSCGVSFPDNCCTPQCGGKQCGGDGCGGSCGSCTAGFECDGGQCVKCTPECGGKQCGGDGCGGSCGTCPDGGVCSPAGQCVACVPSCEGKLCGSDGCGGTCGTCEVDCAALPAGPFPLQKLSGPMASEDLAFDDAGNVVGSNDKAIFKSKYGSSPQLFVPSFNFRAGMRFLPTGDLMVNKDTTGQLVRIGKDGTQTVVLNNLAYPNGMAIDQEGFAWVTEHDADRVLKVDPYAKTSVVISKGTIKNPNGICFNPDYTTVYVAGFSGVGTIYAFPINPDGSVGQVYAWATKVGTGWLDGIGVDVCGNLYIADYYATKIYRFPPDGKSYKTVINGSGGNNVYLPNMDWGSGLGGWDAKKLYLPDGWNKGVFEVDIGVPGKPRVYP